MLSTLFFIFFCLLWSAFFSGIETGVISIHRMRLRHLSEAGERRARILESFLDHPDRLLGTTLTGNNLVNVAASVMAASLGRDLFGGWGEWIMGTTIMLLLLVFGEYLPKAWFQGDPTERCRSFAFVLHWSAIVLRPLANAVMWISQCLLPSSVKDQPRRPLFATKDEIDLLAQESEAHGVLSPRQRIMIRRVLDLSAKSARDIMRPIAAVITTRADATVDELCAQVREGGHARLPVFDTVRRTYIGTINFFDVISGARDGAQVRVMTFVRPPLFIPEGTALVEVFTRLRVSRQPMCLVVNAKSEVTGVVTTQDVLGQIVGAL